MGKVCVELKVHGGTKQENWIVAAISFKPQLTLILVEDWGWECKSVGRVKTCGKVFSRTSNQGRVQVRQLGGRLGGKKRLLSSSSLCPASISPSENWSASGLQLRTVSCYLGWQLTEGQMALLKPHQSQEFSSSLWLQGFKKNHFDTAFPAALFCSRKFVQRLKDKSNILPWYNGQLPIHLPNGKSTSYTHKYYPKLNQPYPWHVATLLVSLRSSGLQKPTQQRKS